MTLTTSSNRNLKEFRETYLWAMKKSVGMLALLALLMFIAFPMILMIAMTNGSHNTDEVMTAAKWISVYTKYVSILSFFASALTLVFVVVTAVSQFSYLHQKRSVDLFHALPVGRVAMLLGRYCAALTTLFVPILLNFTVTSMVGFSYGIAAQYSFTAVAVQMLWMMLMGTAALTFSVFMAICTGTTFDMVISILGINVAYPLLVFASSTFASQLLPGLKIELSPQSTVLTALSPFAAAFLPLINTSENTGSGRFNTSGGFLAWWILFTVFLLAGSILLYWKRKSECAESSFAFPLPKIIIRFIITAVTGIGFGLVLQTTTSTPSSFFIGVISGSLAAHIVVEAVYSRGFQQMKQSFGYYGIFAVTFLVFYGVLATGFFGYDTRLPSADQVESVSVSAPGEYTKGDTIYDSESHQFIARISPILKDKININKVIELQRNLNTILRNTSYPYSVNNDEYARFTLTYHLKNGRTMKRSYPYYGSGNKDDNEFRASLRDTLDHVAQMEEFRKTNSILFYLEPQYIKSISIDIYSGKVQTKDLPVVPDTNAKEELLEALKQDYLSGKIDNPNSREDVSLGISIDFEDPITLKDGGLKTFLGGHSGKIDISGSNYYNLSVGAEKTKELIKKYGWDK